MFLSKSGTIKSSVRSVPKALSVENNKKANKSKRDNYKINPKSIIPKKVDAKDKQSNWIDKFISKPVASSIKAKPLTYEKNKKNDVHSNKNIKEQKKSPTEVLLSKPLYNKEHMQINRYDPVQGVNKNGAISYFQKTNEDFVKQYSKKK